jgi:hypothetical protein
VSKKRSRETRSRGGGRRGREVRIGGIRRGGGEGGGERRGGDGGGDVRAE